MLDERKRLILRAITDDYIASAEPVGSRTIARKYALGVSPATIRNEMADLEEAGYLEQPHTSAGRIPSDKGYRFYVDSLIEPITPSSEEQRRLQEEVLLRAQAFEDVFHRAARFIAALTQYTSLVVVPSAQESVCTHFQLIALDANHLLVVLVTEPGFVQNRILRLDEPIEPNELARLNAFLGQRLRGVTISDVTATLISELRSELSTSALFQTVLELLTSGLDHPGEERVYLEGVMNIFEHPEFRDVERAKNVLSIFDERETMLSVVDEVTQRPGMTVVIGSENAISEMRECSLATATITLRGRSIGTIGLLGPTRMDYARVIGLLQFVSEGLSEYLTERRHR